MFYFESANRNVVFAMTFVLTPIAGWSGLVTVDTETA